MPSRRPSRGDAPPEAAGLARAAAEAAGVGPRGATPEAAGLLLAVAGSAAGAGPPPVVEADPCAVAAWLGCDPSRVDWPALCRAAVGAAASAAGLVSGAPPRHVLALAPCARPRGECGLCASRGSCPGLAPGAETGGGPCVRVGVGFLEALAGAPALVAWLPSLCSPAGPRAVGYTGGLAAAVASRPGPAGAVACCALLCGAGPLPPLPQLSGVWGLPRVLALCPLGAQGAPDPPRAAAVAVLEALAPAEDREVRSRDAEFRRRAGPALLPAHDEVLAGLAGWRQRYYFAAFGTTHASDITRVCQAYAAALREALGPGGPGAARYPYGHAPTAADLLMWYRVPAAPPERGAPEGGGRAPPARAPGYLGAGGGGFVHARDAA